MKSSIGGFALTLLIASTVGAAAQDLPVGDPVAGKRVFGKCAGCHYYNKEKKKLGPHLVGIFDRKIGSIEKFKYSKPFKKIAEDGMVWDEKTLDEYFKDPVAFTKKYGGRRGNMMLKLKDPQDRADVIAFLKDKAKLK